jgi:pimeloyl-ACP methyl ester carboxylesterase
MDFANFQQLNFTNRDCKIHYWYRRGTTRETILLLHGAGCDHLMFEKQIGIFGNAYNIIAWDARGHGLSALDRGKKFCFDDMYADCLHLFEIHRMEQAVLIGQSMGGNLAQEVARHHPERVSRLILIDCTRNTQRLTAWERLIVKLSGGILRLYPWQTYIQQSLTVCGYTEYTRNYVRNCMERMGKEKFVEIIASVLTCLHEDRRFRMKQPTLLLCGEKDTSGNVRKAMRTWADDDKNCRLRIIYAAAHNSNQDNPDEVNRLIASFLA